MPTESPPQFLVGIYEAPHEQAKIWQAMIEIRKARVPEELGEVARLFREYAASLSVDLCFQNFEAELEGLPGAYAAPRGCLLLAAEGEIVLGCVALRPLGATDCEMKRLYVRPAGRRRGVGMRLVEAVCSAARAAGFARICLDTLPEMAQAQSLYRNLGFREVTPYVFNPIPGAKYMARLLQSA